MRASEAEEGDMGLSSPPFPLLPLPDAAFSPYGSEPEEYLSLSERGDDLYKGVTEATKTRQDFTGLFPSILHQ